MLSSMLAHDPWVKTTSLAVVSTQGRLPLNISYARVLREDVCFEAHRNWIHRQHDISKKTRPLIVSPLFHETPRNHMPRKKEPGIQEKR
jgi:hypothetical protein